MFTKVFILGRCLMTTQHALRAIWIIFKLDIYSIFLYMRSWFRSKSILLTFVPCCLSWYVMTFHGLSGYGPNQLREVRKGLRIHNKFIGWTESPYGTRIIPRVLEMQGIPVTDKPSYRKANVCIFETKLIGQFSTHPTQHATPIIVRYGWVTRWAPHDQGASIYNKQFIYLQREIRLF